MSAEDYGVEWEGQPTPEDYGWGADIVEILDDWWETNVDYEAQEQWQVHPPSFPNASMTFYAPPGAVEDVKYYTDVYPVDRGSRLADPNYELTDEDMVEFDVPRNRYMSQSNPERQAPRPTDLPAPARHGVDVRPGRRGPRMRREW